MLFKLVFGYLIYKRKHFSFATVGTSVSIFGFVIFLSIGEGIRKFVNSAFMQSYIHIYIYKNNPFSTVPDMDVSIADSIAKLNIGEVYRILRIPYPVGFPPRGMVLIVGKDMSSKLKFVSKYELLEGKDIESDGRNVIVGKRALKLLAKNLGDSIMIGKHYYKIVGVITSDDGVANNFIIAPLNKIMEDYNLKRINVVGVSLNDLRMMDEVMDSLRKAFPDYQVESATQMLKEINVFLLFTDFIRSAISSIGLVVGIVLLFSILYITSQERLWEFALLRALGSSRTLIFRIVIIQAISLGIISWLISLLISYPVSFVINYLSSNVLGFDASIITFRLVLFSFIISIIVSILGGFIPAYYSSKVNIRRTLGGGL